MFIKTVTIEGFKSYRRRTIVNFEDGLNIIMGSNGAGKSNLLSAIEFVVSPEYLEMPQKKKEELICSGISGLLPIASVEIVFEDNDKRLKANSNQTILRREVSKGRDVLSCDGKHLSKDEFKAILNRAGISKMNSYYIIKQGNANKLTEATNAGRLTLMKEAIGSSLWEELKPQDLARLKDAEGYLERSEKEMCELDKQINYLIIEKQEYERWKKISDRKKSLEFCIIQKDRKHQGEKMETLLDRVSQLEAQYRKTMRDVEQCTIEKSQLMNDLEFFEAELQNVQENLNEMSHSLNELAVQETKLLLEIAEREKQIRRQKDEVSLREKLNNLDQEIGQKRLNLDATLRDYEAAIRKKSHLNKGLMIADEKLKEFHTLSVQTECYHSQEARDHAINQEIESLKQLRDKEEADLNRLLDQLEWDTSEKRRLEALLMELDAKKNEELRRFEECKKTKGLWRDELRRIQLNQNELRRKENEKMKTLNESLRYYEKQRVEFSRVASISLVNALTSVCDAIRSMAKEGMGSAAHEMACGYRGVVIDQFECQDSYYTMLHAISGNRLFEHIVDNEDVAVAILDKIEQMRLTGAPIFHALNRIVRRSNPLVETELTIPLMSCLSNIKPETSVVLEKLFGRWMVCRDLDTACQVANKLGCNCATLKGQTVMDFGAMKGGHYSEPIRRLHFYHEIRAASNVVEQQKNELEDIRISLRELGEENTSALSRLQETEWQLKHIHLEKAFEDYESTKETLATLEAAIQGKKDQKTTFSLSIDSTRAKIEALNIRLHQPFNSELSAEETAEIQRIRDDLSQARSALSAAVALCHRLNNDKSMLEFELHENLMKMKRDLEKSLSDLLLDDAVILQGTNDDDASQGNQQENFIRELNEHLELVRTHLEEKSKEVKGMEEKAAMRRRDIEENRKGLDDIKCRLADKRKILKDQIEKYTETKRKIQLQEAKKNDYADKELDFDKNKMKRYKKLSHAQLEDKLASANRKLKEFTLLNMRASMDYDSIQPKIDALKKRLAVCKKDNEECMAVIKRVDDAKNHAMQFSLKQIAKGFEKLFNTFVNKSGRGKLRWVYQEVDDDSEDEESHQREMPDIDRLTGIAIDVSFTGGTQLQTIKSLSGGQKSVVSLSLVFAVLLMDRAPFYVFDETDMALDDNYREAIAETISGLARESQFIVTTFRLELMEFAKNIVRVSFDEASSTSSCSDATLEEAQAAVARSRRQ